MTETKWTPSRAEFIALVAALITINAAAIDVMLPALPDMGAAFGLENPNDRSLVLTVFVIGLGLPQLVFGPLTDRYGRRGPLLAGLAVFTAAAFASTLVPTFAALLVVRFIQGAGSSVVNVAINSAVRDRYTGSEMAEILSMAFSVFMIVPIVAPSVGQLILFSGVWQLIFVFMGGVGLAFGLWAWLRLPETLHPEYRRPFTARSITEGFAIVLSNRAALFYGIAGMFMFGSILGFVNTAQQIYVGIYGLGALFPFVFALTPLTFAAAFFINARIVRRFGMRRVAHGGMLIYAAAATVWLACALAGFMPLWLFVLMMMLIALGQGVAWGNVGALQMEPLGEVAGTAAAVFGSFATVGAAIVGLVVAQVFDGTATPVIATFFVFGLCVIGCFLIAERGRLFAAPQAGGPPQGAAAL